MTNPTVKITITEMAQATLKTYRILLSRGWTRNDARGVVRTIYELHGFGKNGYLRHAIAK
jgi:hypothetical protein